MDDFFTYIINNMKSFENNTLPNYPDPADPVDLGTPLTQDQIDFVKKLKKEMEERFPSS